MSENPDFEREAEAEHAAEQRPDSAEADRVGGSEEPDLEPQAAAADGGGGRDTGEAGTGNTDPDASFDPTA